MDHPDETLVHDFVDGELAGEEGGRVAAHLAACPECAALAASLRGLRERAHAAFGEAAADPTTADAPDHWDVIAWRIRAARRERRRTRLASAAVIVLIAGSVASTWALLRAPDAQDPGPAVAAAAGNAPAARPASTIAVAYAPELSALERRLVEERARLQPETVAIIDENLAILNDAIREIEAALAADPAHRGNLRSLEGMYQTKLGVLRHAVELTQGA